MSVLDSNLAARVGTAVVVLPALLAAFFLGPWWLGVGVIAVACLVALYETFGLMRARGLTPLIAAGDLALAATFAQVLCPYTWPPLLPAVMVIVLATVLTEARRMETSLTSAALTLFGFLFLVP